MDCKNASSCDSSLVHKELTSVIISACFEVINELGAGFVESVYEKYMPELPEDAQKAVTALREK